MRDAALAAALTDVKVCAADTAGTALQFVHRPTDRARA